jgi:hypothetical protein
MQAIFAQAVAQDADARVIAEKAATTWCAIAAALSPIIGPRAVVALYKRSLGLVRGEYPWLSPPEGHPEPDDFVLLRTALSQQSDVEATAAHRALLQTFLDLLASLLGESLTERLLKSVWDTSSSAGIAQDTSS